MCTFGIHVDGGFRSIYIFFFVAVVRVFPKGVVRFLEKTLFGPWFYGLRLCVCWRLVCFPTRMEAGYEIMLCFLEAIAANKKLFQPLQRVLRAVSTIVATSLCFFCAFPPRVNFFFFSSVFGTKRLLLHSTERRSGGNKHIEKWATPFLFAEK